MKELQYCYDDLFLLELNSFGHGAIVGSPIIMMAPMEPESPKNHAALDHCKILQITIILNDNLFLLKSLSIVLIQGYINQGWGAN